MAPYIAGIMSRAVAPEIRLRLMFAAVCLVWGGTWLAMKEGVATVPPGFFSGTRWTVAGLMLVGVRLARGKPVRPVAREWPRLIVLSVLMIAMNAVIQQYGLRYVDSGLGAVIGSALTPLFLLGLAMGTGQERFSQRQAVAIGLGIAGILVLFGPKTLAGRLDPGEAWGALGVAVATFCYCLGSVLSRPTLRTMPPAQVAAATNLTGGVILLVGSLAFEPGSWQAAHLAWGLRAWAGWLFLLLPGSLFATIMYFMLLREWGASRAGTYAFVSPVVAVLLGMAVGEHVGPVDAGGMLLMLVAAGVALYRVPAPAAAPAAVPVPASTRA
jgi:drug/metabolite transporter (DMT)-like permease